MTEPAPLSPEDDAALDQILEQLLQSELTPEVRDRLFAGFVAQRPHLEHELRDLLRRPARSSALGLQLDQELPQVPGYTLHGRIAGGAFGAVYRAHRPTLGTTPFAVKVLTRPPQDQAAHTRFDTECRVLATLDHPHIVRFFHHGLTATGQPYYAMEYIEGRPITTYCAEERLDLTARVALLLQVCDALQVVHQARLVHRDLKPDNLLVSTRGDQPWAKVCDFGLVKSLGHQFNPSVTLEGSWGMGTPLYMSPEQALRGGSDVNSRSDVYALGAVLYELLTGKPPVPMAALAAALEQGRPAVERLLESLVIAPPSAALTAAPGPGSLQDLDRVALKALRFERHARYADAGELAADLRRWLAGTPVLAGGSGGLDRWRRRVWSRRRLLVPLAMVVLATWAVASWLGGRSDSALLRDLLGSLPPDVQERLRESDAELGRRLRAFTARSRGGTGALVLHRPRLAIPESRPRFEVHGARPAMAGLHVVVLATDPPGDRVRVPLVADPARGDVLVGELPAGQSLAPGWYVWNVADRSDPGCAFEVLSASAWHDLAARVPDAGSASINQLVRAAVLLEREACATVVRELTAWSGALPDDLARLWDRCLAEAYARLDDAEGLEAVLTRRPAWR